MKKFLLVKLCSTIEIDLSEPEMNWASIMELLDSMRQYGTGEIQSVEIEERYESGAIATK